MGEFSTIEHTVNGGKLLEDCLLCVLPGHLTCWLMPHDIFV